MSFGYVIRSDDCQKIRMKQETGRMDSGSKRKFSSTAVLLAAVLASLFFVSVLGTQILDPTSISWLMNEIDWAQHFLGWHLFRNEGWHFPPGKLASIENPVGASVGYTDSIPVMAFLFKPLTKILPDNFQYFGLWLLLCFCLQGVFAALLMRTVSSHWINQLLGAALFVITPILIGRIGHPALCSHWILLASLWLHFREWKSFSLFRHLSSWGILTVLSAAIHPFIAIMTLGLAFAFYLRSWLFNHMIKLKYGIFNFSMLIFLTLLVWWIAGYFGIGQIGPSYGTFGYGYFSMNLAAPGNPVGWSGGIWGGRCSTFFKAWPAATKGQGEGFNYLGIGMIILGLWAFLVSIRRPPKFKTIKTLLPLGFVCLCFTLLALSQRITFANYAIAEIKLNHYLLAALSPFRSSGRFFWPVYYSVVFIIIAFLLRRHKLKIGIAILLFGLILQLVDFHNLYDAFERVRHPQKEWNNPLQSKFWAEIGKNYERIVLVPPRGCEEEAVASYEPFAYLAANHGMSVNSFYLARYNYEASSRYCNDLISDVKNGVIDPESVYILNEEYLDVLKTAAKIPIICMIVDGFHICLSEKGNR